MSYRFADSLRAGSGRMHGPIDIRYSKMSAAQTLKGLLSEAVTNTSDANLKSNYRIEIKEAN